MKTRHILFGLASAAMMTIAGCETAEIKDVQSPEANASSFELIADITQTKTTLDPQDGYKVAWEERDIIYMVTSDGTWGVPYNEDETTNSIAEFTYADGKFSTEATIADGEYTFKGIYAAASQKSYHRGASTTHKLVSTQTQDCADPTAHIKDNDALVGTFTATVPMAEPATVAMKHIHTLMQVNIKNNTGNEVNITKFEMTVGGQDIAGIFNVVDFSTAATTLKTGYGEKITVNLANGTVAAGGSLPVYFVAAPFTSDAEEGITFKVTTDDGKTYTKTAKIALEFSAGTYNVTPYTISEADVVEVTDYSGTYLIAGENGDKWYAAKKYTSGNYLSVLPLTIKGESIVESDDLIDCYMVITKVDGGDYDGMYTIVDAGGKYLSTSSSSSNNMKAVDSPSKDTYWTITKVQDGYSIVANKSDFSRNDMRFNYNNGTNSRVSCYAVTNTTQPCVNLFSTALIIPDTDPEIVVTDASTTKNIGYEGGEITFNYTLKNLGGETLDIAVSDSDMLSASAEAGVLTVTVAENEGEEREATITLTCGEAEPVVLTVIQDKYAGGGDGGTNDPIVLTADWNTNVGALETSGCTNSFRIGDYTYTASGTNCYYYENGKACFLGKSGAYISLPAIDGYKLTNVTLTSAKSTGGANVTIKDSSNSNATSSTASFANGESKDFSFDITSPVANYSYRICVTNSKNAHIAKWVLTYQPTN